MKVYGEEITEKQIADALQSLRGKAFYAGLLEVELGKQNVNNVARCADRILQRMRKKSEIVFRDGKWHWLES